MWGQAGFWDIDERYVRLSEAGDPLEKLNTVVSWEVFRKPLSKALKRSDGLLQACSGRRQDLAPPEGGEPVAFGSRRRHIH